MSEIIYHKEKLKRILDDIYRLMGINIAIFDVDGNSIYTSGDIPDFCRRIQNVSGGLAKCACSDRNMRAKCELERRFIVHKCHAGITDSAMPIVKNSVIVGYVVIGRIRTGQTFDEIKGELAWVDYSEAQMKSAYESLPELTVSQLDSLADLLSNIVFADAIEIEDKGFKYRISKYIKDNLEHRLTISELCTAMYMSKNKLYENFREDFGCTVNEYIILNRISRAQELLISTDEKISEISETVGIPNYTYFCRLFKAKTGYTPLAYRKKFS